MLNEGALAGVKTGRVALAYVGSVVPDTTEFRNAAFSFAGNMFQLALINSLHRSGLVASAIISARPIPSYPKVPPVVIRRQHVEVKDGLRVELVPFLNVTPLKQVTIGLSVLYSIVKWAWLNRSAEHRVVYTYNLSVPPGLFTLVAARLARAKAVVSLCDVNEPGHTVPSTLPYRLDYWLQRRLIPRFDGLVVVTDRMVKELAPRSKHLRMEGGVQSEVFELTGESCRRPADGRFVVSAAGALEPVNGIQTILEAFTLLKGSQYRLRIAGTGSLVDKVREAGRSDTRIEYLGLLPFREVLRLYCASDLLLNMRMTRIMSTKYFFPSKLMEYLASGTPVLTTCTGHVESEYGELVYLLREETPSALAEALERIATVDPVERLARGCRARDYMVRAKTWPVQAGRVAGFILEDVLGLPSASERVEGMRKDAQDHAQPDRRGTG